ncbi:hypothetical protein GCM10027046_34210 [Uliginosibacterium flavum]|uniref:DUF6756 family protein n=1 Tax=Uliginosibacterium flavum TaxID=1396831 RepID=A0ABV2TMK0_9RHOO
MDTVVDEIRNAVAVLKLPQDAMCLLPDGQSLEVFNSALNRFVSGGDRAWWWESFREPGASVQFSNGDGWKYLPSIAPSENEKVWFVAEESALPHYPVFETTPRIASEVISQCYAFEYYLVAKDLSWLICETHHNVVCAIGPLVEQRLRDNAV